MSNKNGIIIDNALFLASSCALFEYVFFESLWGALPVFALLVVSLSIPRR
jgi:hypothetical protein